MCQVFQIPEEYAAIGIVMRLEDGGTLQQYIYKQTLNMEMKLCLLTEIAQVIADMHSSGIIHGDLKPENVLLSSHQPPKIRLADFGLAEMRMKDQYSDAHSRGMVGLDGLQGSTLQHTQFTRGTPIYCAPEMFHDPFSDQLTHSVAKASRKTDMYAFAVMVWEILTQKRPFMHMLSEAVLVTRIYQGVRPDTKELPADCPATVKLLLTRCWHMDRDMRKSAIDC